MIGPNSGEEEDRPEQAGGVFIAYGEVGGFVAGGCMHNVVLDRAVSRGTRKDRHGQ
jgi:hypothetical protein